MNVNDKFEKLELKEIDDCLLFLFIIGIIPEACKPMEPFLVIEISSMCNMPFL